MTVFEEYVHIVVLGQIIETMFHRAFFLKRLILIIFQLLSLALNAMKVFHKTKSTWHVS